MSQSTEVARRKTPTADAVLARRIEANAIASETYAKLAAAMTEVYVRIEGLPLHPIGYWFFNSAGPTTPATLNGTLARDYDSPTHEKRQRLNEWAKALGAEITETRDYGSRIKLRATCVVGGVPVAVEVDVDHRCTCTGQCNGDVL
ncbi:hypothetical protein [Streptacidiphilus sp. EB103A]|uniref:hypothetical protein n=1 Tax=Streptacidiphilus sp. EB103A TaxID=3156275 RepID=UPI0035141F44